MERKYAGILLAFVSDTRLVEFNDDPLAEGVHKLANNRTAEPTGKEDVRNRCRASR
jgi:hypothetical protein